MSLDILPRLLPRDLRPTSTSADTGSTEKTVLYDCGTAAPGQVHDPCQHSTVTVLCCPCAGCMFDVWTCAQAPVPADSWPWWEAHVIAERFDPWVRHPCALVLYALLVVFLLASQIIQTVIEILLGVGMIIVAALVFTAARLLT